MKKVAVIMGSKSDWNTMKQACDVLEAFQVEYDKIIVSAHRTPENMMSFSLNAKKQGYHVIIAGAGGAAHLPGMVASLTLLPVIGVPILSKQLNGLDSLLSIVSMPKGVPVGTMAIDGAKNAALYAVRILSLSDEKLSDRLNAFCETQTQEVLSEKDQLGSL